MLCHAVLHDIKEREGEVKALGIISSNFLSPQSCLGLARIAP